MRALALAILAFVLSLPHGGSALAEPSHSVRADVSPGEGRLIFGWDAPTTVRATLSGRRLTLQFSRPFAADLFVPMARLAPWLSNLAAEARPGEVSLELRDGVSADVLEGAAATTIIVALRHRPSGAGSTTTATMPSRDPVLNIRTGIHPGFGRLVLESDGPLRFETRRERNELVVATEVPLPERAPTQALALSRWITAATAEDRTLRLRLGSGVVVREERPDAAKLVLDFAIPASRHAAVPAIAPRAPERLTGVAEADSDVRSVVEERGAVISPKSPDEEAVTPSGGPVQAHRPDVAPHVGPKILTPKAAPAGEATIATFRWRKPVPAAVFERADTLWIVFGAPAGDLAGADIPALDAAGMRDLGRTERQGLTVFRYLRASREPLHMTGGGAAWHLHRGEAPKVPGEGHGTLVSRGHGGRLLLATAGTLAKLADPEAGDVLNLLLVPQARARLDAPLTLVDLELTPTLTGIVWRSLVDDLSIIPGSASVEFSRPGGLRSAFSPWRPAPGVPPPERTRAAGQPEDSRAFDGTSSKRTSDAGDDLAAAVSTLPEDRDRAQSRSPDVAVEPLALAGSFDQDGPPLSVLRQELLGQLAALKGEEAYPARLRLARLFLADALGAEAPAVLDAAAPEVESANAVAVPPKREAALRAAADLLLGRERQAGELLAGIPDGGDDAELALWRATAAAALERWDETARELTRAGSVWAAYPPRLRFRIGLAVAGALGEAGRIDPALALADQLANLPASPLDSAKLSLVKASLLDRDGRGAAASAAFADAVRDGGFEVGVTARFLRIVSGRERGEITADEARRRLAEERLAWRGHAWETRMFDVLAGLQADGGDPAAALATWQTILSRGPDETAAANILGRMRKGLARALAADNPASVDPVTGLALLRTFPTLLPDSDAGRRLVDGVAQRLAEAGLPAQAANLLADQQTRAGPPTASGLFELAGRRLAADEPDATLAALSRIDPRTEISGGQGDLAEARALLALGRPGEALRLIEKHPGPEFSEARALALWRIGAWARLREELASYPQGTGDGPEGERRVRLAIADARAGVSPAPAERAEPTAGEGIQAFLDAVSASAPAVGSARSVADELSSRVGALRSGLETLRTAR